VTLQSEKVTGQKDPNIPYVGLEHMAQGEPALLGTVPSNLSTSVNSIFKSGDILFGKLRPNLRKSLQIKFDGYCSTDILIFRTRPEILPEFASKVFQSEALFEEAVRTAEGTKMPRTSWDKLRKFHVFVPSRIEQRRIAQILDTLDILIQGTQRLIAKLKQIKDGLLHDLITNGIDEHGKVRDPVLHPEQFKEVLQGKLKVPNEWNIFPLKKIAEIGSGVTLGRNLIGANTIELPYLRVANVQDGYLDLTEIKTVRVIKDEVHRFLLQPGDVLMTEGGDFDKLGRGTVWTGEISPCLHQNHIFRVRTNRDYLYPDFLALVCSSSYGRHFFLLSSKQSTNLASINSTQLKAFPVPCPHKREQERIHEVLNFHDTRISAEETYLSKLQQIKKGLMHNLLTGTVRVSSLMTTCTQ
jgi:type I restriction enzyme, S subunit